MKFPLGDHAQLHTRKGQEYAHAFFFSYEEKWGIFNVLCIELAQVWWGILIKKKEKAMAKTNYVVPTKLSGLNGINYLILWRQADFARLKFDSTWTYEYYITKIGIE